MLKIIISSILNSGALGTIISLFGIIITIVLYQISQRKMLPNYFITDFEIIAKSVGDNSLLKILWETKEVKNINKIQFAFYNSGKTPIKKSDISSDYPISIKCPNSVNLLESYVSEISRKEINISNRNDIENKKIELRIINDEAFEQKDGFIVDILFTTEAEIIEKEWKMEARIFGVPKGIKRKNPRNIRKIDSIIMLLFTLLSVFILVFVFNIKWDESEIYSITNLKYPIYIGFFGVILGLTRLFLNNIPLWLKQKYWKLLGNYN